MLRRGRYYELWKEQLPDQTYIHKEQTDVGACVV